MRKKEGASLFFSREGERVLVEPYGPGVIRVRMVAGGPFVEESWTLLPPQPSHAQAREEGGDFVLENEGLSARLEENGRLSFWAGGKLLLREEWTPERDMTGRSARCRDGGLYRMETRFLPQKDEHFYGMGQEAHDLFDLKGAVVELCHQNTKSNIPFCVSTRGYGFLWNHPGAGRAEFGASRTRWVSDGSRQMDYLVLAGSVAQAVERYAALTGYAPPFPAWAAGLWQSKLRYETQDELLAVAREYKKRGIPLSMIVCDYFHWPQQGEWKFDERYWPDPQAMVDELNGMGVRLLVSIWPTVDPRSENYRRMRDENMLVRTERGPGTLVYCRGPETYYDATNPEAGAFVWGRVRENYGKYGIRHFWLDEAEPEIAPYDYDNLRFYRGNGLEVSGLYPFYYAKNFYDGQRAQGQQDVVNLIRCAFLGSQRFGVVLWSGDISANFDSLRRQVKTGLHVALSGIPWWTTDIGGFHGGDPADPAYRECFVRWFQFGAFCPVFRMHGFRFKADRPQVSSESMDSYCYSGGPNELWSYGEEAYAILRDYVMLRERLRPYLLEQMEKASRNGTPVMRPLFYDFGEQPHFPIYETYDQYLFGPALMVCPVCEAGVRERDVHLPAGCRWTDVRTGETWDGGRTVRAAAPLHWMPLFLREGAGLSRETLLGLSPRG